MPISHHSDSEFVWISQHDPMPDVCCSCGMFTDNRIKFKHSVLVEKTVAKNSGCFAVFLTLAFHVFLGGAGWLISALLNSDDSDKATTKTVKEAYKFKLSQCRLCHGTSEPEVVDSETHPARVMLLVHPQFKSRFAEEKKKRLNQDQSDF